MTKKITVILTGGIAVYKSLELLRLLLKDGYQIKVVMTEASQKFITPFMVSSLVGGDVYCDLFSLTEEQKMGHIALARWSDLVVVMPASADFMAKAAYGFASDLASTLLLASKAPLVFIPSMNPTMWQHAAVQDNVRTLMARGCAFLCPDEGLTACGEEGVGRSVEPCVVKSWIDAFFVRDAPRVLITAGPTRSSIDPVRYISNYSSGKQGYAIADVFRKRGYHVTLVSGPTALAVPSGVRMINVETAQDMYHACLQEIKEHVYDVAVCCAAVSDWVMERKNHKIKKTDNVHLLRLPIQSYTPDILQSITENARRPRCVVGFAAETDNVEGYACQKFLSKTCDIMIANQVCFTDNCGEEQNVFGAEINKIFLITAQGNIAYPVMSKYDIAHLICDMVEQ